MAPDPQRRPVRFPPITISHRPRPPRLTRRGLLAAAAGGAGLVLSGCGGSEASVLEAGDTPVEGGTLRVGITGGGASDTVDAHVPLGTGDAARMFNLYDTLFAYDADYRVVPALAESAEPNETGDQWTITLREGVRFHDGRPLTPADVKATFERILDPEDPKSGASKLATLESVEEVDERTVRFVLGSPDAVLTDALAQYVMGIVPQDYDPADPVGTGPFRLTDFEPGGTTHLTAFDDYWQGRPHVDEVLLMNFDDEDALMNSLLSSQVDVIAQVPLPLVHVVSEDPRIQVITSETGNWVPFTMRTDTAPFDDPRVREAFKLVIDREQMVEVAFAGQGRVGNDMYSPFDSGYPQEAPQRERDIERAKQLLSEAGHPDGLSVELVTAPIQAGAVEAATVFAEQAADAGIDVSLRRVDATTFFGSGYLEFPFAQSFYYTRNFLPQAADTSLPDSPYNETHWDQPEFTRLVAQARETLDDAEREELTRRAMQLHHDEGGNIIFGFFDVADAYQRYVGGGASDRSGMPIASFRFRNLWIETGDAADGEA
ncbi:ABC transporter substrate-binding protein [Kocuria sp. p3-SID1433]|uniref:ABC transporter substrate-binding protein n=1 Tax=unclassified Kocuria TaxID=2649579 RepID=UPI0021A319F3|nr:MULTISPECIES: ABC transporter substrate-binding protein [unclassified Kocuria]MCT1602691.1 ABC transporter substrate-binding protein [Kocuria sp. p3-SID1428]MCT2180242.1 ABC transporter substrate-binding protein [Kocuria sp. p3-SID1433]